MDAVRSTVGVVFANNLFAAGFNNEKPPKALFVELDAAFKLPMDELSVLGVVNFVFDNLFALKNGEFCDTKPVFSKSLGFKRKRSRKSQADVCLTRAGRFTADSFFVVLNVARAGLIGVTVDGVVHFTPDDVVGFAFFVFGVYLDDIFQSTMSNTSIYNEFLTILIENLCKFSAFRKKCHNENR